MSLFYRQTETTLIVYGNTFPFKDDLKALGAKFNYADKTWFISMNEELIVKVKDLCDRANGGATVNDLPAPPTDGMTVGELLQQINSTIVKGFPSAVWIVGEIENFTMRGQHCFFGLAEQKDGNENATLSVKATVWASNFVYLVAKHGEDLVKTVFQDGTKVRCLCKVQFFKDRAQISLAIEDIDPSYTKGALALAREKLLKKLRQLGIDQKNKKTTLPAFPFRIGLISAQGSRAYSDFIDQLLTNQFPGEVIFVSAAMQGEQVSQNVCHAIARLNDCCDLIVITRGGGSASDLRWFDDEDMALAIANCPVPIIAAIGHHDDTCVAEEVCYLRQKTPTAAADFVLDIFHQVSVRLDQAERTFVRQLAAAQNSLQKLQLFLMERLTTAVEYCLSGREKTLAYQWSEIFSRMKTRVEGELHVNRNLAVQLDHTALQQFDRLQIIAGSYEKTFAARDPRPWMEQGWTQLWSDGGRILSTQELHIGQKIYARLLDGKVQLHVDHVEKTS